MKETSHPTVPEPLVIYKMPRGEAELSDTELQPGPASRPSRGLSLLSPAKGNMVSLKLAAAWQQWRVSDWLPVLLLLFPGEIPALGACVDAS